MNYLKNILDKIIIKILNIYDYIPRTMRKIRKIIHWIPVIWKFECWDWYYLLEVWKFAVNENVEFYSDKNKVHVIEKQRIEIRNSLKRLYKILDKIQNNEWYPPEKEIKELKKRYKVKRYSKKTKGYRKFVFTCTDDNAYNKEFKQLLKNQSKKQQEEFKKLYDELRKNLYKYWD